MKKLIVLPILLLLTFGAMAQSSLKEKEILGTWKLKIDLKEEFDKEKDKENALANAILDGISGFMDTLFDAIDIQFTFKKYGDVEIRTNTSLNKKETVEEGTWEISEDGYLHIYGMKDSKVNFDKSEGWVLKKDRLYLQSKKDRAENVVYLVKN
jgi:hypothetical protein